MQTPLITNFARGVISPKYTGRIDTEIYHQGAAIIEDFIVNNQGSLQRRPGTYLVWNTGFTSPSPEGVQDNRFVVESDPARRFSLLLLNDEGDSAQFILSKGGESPQHRFFEITRTQSNWEYDPELFCLSQFEDTGELFPEAHAFIVGDDRVIDDAFVSTISGLTFLRLRNPSSYTDLKVVSWHATASRDIARLAASAIPFVHVGPARPPDYRKDKSYLDHNVGFVISDSDGAEIDRFVYRTRKVPQFVGQIVSGTFDDQRQRSVISRSAGVIKNISQETLISDMGKIRIAVPNTRTADISSFTMVDGTLTPALIPRTYKFYPWAPGRATVQAAKKSIAFTPYPTPQQITIDFSQLEQATKDWTALTSILVTRVHSRRRRRLFRSNKTVYDNNTEKIDIGDEWLDDYRDRTYNLNSTVAWSVLSTYRLVYRHGPSELVISTLPIGEMSNDVFSIAQTSDVVTTATIANEADINPLEGHQLPAAGAEYIIERVLADGEDQDVISRRTKPWVKDEAVISDSLEFIDTESEWVNYSIEKFEAGKSVIIHNGRMLIQEDENSLTFSVSAIRDYVNFYQGDSEVDGYGFNIETERNERIQWAVSVRDAIILGTDRNEYLVMGAVSPSSVQSQRYTGIGSSRPYAIRFGDKILFISRDGKRIMAYSYSDELSAWFSSDVSSIAEHLFTSGIQSIHYMEDPISAICVVPEGNNGIYLLTWEPTYGVQAWTHHMKGQNVLAATVATISGVTGLFLAVERGNTVMIEALDFREDGVFGVQHYLDSSEFLFWGWDDQSEDGALPVGTDPDGEALDGETNYTINFGTGRWSRFQGKDVIIQIDGNTAFVYEGANQPHSTTSITIGPYEGANILLELPTGIANDGGIITVAIGTPFVSRLETLPIMVQSPSGAGMMKNTQTQKARVRIESSSDFQAGPDFEDMTRVSVDEGQDMVRVDDDRQRYTGDIMIPLTSKWSYRPKICIESYYAEPLNVLAIMADSQVFE